ncbi:MAG: hypothetical protein ACRDSR_22815 [Pseudonocardiaceae bacterium]
MTAAQSADHDRHSEPNRTLAAPCDRHSEPNGGFKGYPTAIRNRIAIPATALSGTGVLWEHADSGVNTRQLAEAFELTVGEVQWALAYENAQGAARFRTAFMAIS